jgi:hypothetical protein
MARLVHADAIVEPSRNDRAQRRSDSEAAPDTVLGGADAVEKTTYVSDVHGADVEAGSRPVPVTASVHAGGASPIAWIAALLAVLALAVYAAGLFS